MKRKRKGKIRSVRVITNETQVENRDKERASYQSTSLIPKVKCIYMWK
jgi:hypothetical protein